MFKIAFPWALHAEEKAERDYLKSKDSTSQDEIAGNVWISPELGALRAVPSHLIYPLTICPCSSRSSARIWPVRLGESTVRPRRDHAESHQC